ncbi:uncharacterized protein LOC119511290 [Choloepus didactylus]|uniref:uncharacterized protein LOC119511290 n=1 Tax=Choloepus didactylus TaxID=27675 RepID=UPI0018A10E42|nr:uncharacterized protein LOC119511290 [Choloepus didactylus]
MGRPRTARTQSALRRLKRGQSRLWMRSGKQKPDRLPAPLVSVNRRHRPHKAVRGCQVRRRPAPHQAQRGKGPRIRPFPQRRDPCDGGRRGAFTPAATRPSPERRPGAPSSLRLEGPPEEDRGGERSRKEEPRKDPTNNRAIRADQKSLCSRCHEDEENFPIPYATESEKTNATSHRDNWKCRHHWNATPESCTMHPILCDLEGVFLSILEFLLLQNRIFTGDKESH